MKFSLMMWKSLGSHSQTNAGELPTGGGWEEVAVGSADVAQRGGAGTAAQDHLIAHEFAVVFADRSGSSLKAWIGKIGTLRPFPHVAKELVGAGTVAGRGWVQVATV